ncbi:Multidrug resistance protein MdtN [Planctomycetes bacterium Poly30]|uniref:Multidrug resistance protein MdtN n=1 Tax=Saltatorellus ferox TaxID=2528018 RepID=A0A518F0C0_9BACT|nr:Multidrug resistance protein MdtN [Planctomycetes bacterium Poly30]
MAKSTRRFAGVLLTGLAVVQALTSCAKEDVRYYQGYVEGEYVYLASPLGGELKELAVARGQTVEAGEVLFRLDPNPEALEASETKQRLDQARAKLADMNKGQRPSEIAAIDARLASARAALEQAEHDYDRRKKLRDEGHADAVSASELERFRTARDVAASEVAMLAAELETAKLGGRPDAVAAAENEVGALGVRVQELEWKVEQKQGVAPAGGIVQDTLYRVGEFVGAGRPVISMLPPENVKIRFFVPESLLPTIAAGDRVEVRLDGVEASLPATISFLSTESEFTPPVIYSKENRAKLVYRIEATPDAGRVNRLRPGQPLEVYLDGSQ